MLVIETELTYVEYIEADGMGHKVDTESGLKSHRGGNEKAGDVILYLNCSCGNARLVNRHNRSGTEPSCYIEVCNGTNNNCKVRSFPVQDAMCIGDVEDTDESVPNTGLLSDGTKYFIYRFLLYTDGFSAHRTRLGSMDGMYMIPLGNTTESTHRSRLFA